ncbi:MAG: lipid-A-disaccharide synthase [Desulfofustis sp.]|nr:lipid-A-disaccharide synthase [Desulfofustis sp.]
MNNEVMIVAGEASGDLHGSRLIASMLERDPSLHFCGIGGPEMKRCGVGLLYDAAKIAVVGIFEVISHLPHLIRAQRVLRTRLKDKPPRLLILIDFPDFNLFLARKAKMLGIPVLYYISPQVWAWRSGRVKTIDRLTDGIGVILPFEEEFYRQRGVTKAQYVGHPLLDTVESNMSRDQFCAVNDIDPRYKLIGILPGSRNKEVRNLLPEFLRAADIFNALSSDPAVFLIPLAPTIEAGELDKAGVNDFRSRLDIRVINRDRYELIGACDAVLTASGTVTLETLLLDTPMVVAYKLTPMSFRLAKLLITLGQFSLVKLGFFSLVNLIAGKAVVLELLQDEANAEALSEELYRLIYDQDRRATQISEFHSIRVKLGQRGASERAAALAFSLLKKND